MRIINDLSLRKFQGFGSSVLGSWDPGMKTPRIYCIATSQVSYTCLDVTFRAFGEGVGSPGEQGREKDRGPRTPGLVPGETELGDLCGKQPRRWWVPKAEGRRCPDGKGGPPLLCARCCWEVCSLENCGIIAGTYGASEGGEQVGLERVAEGEMCSQCRDAAL